MNVIFEPNSQDEPNLMYKLQHKLKVFNTTDILPNRGYNLIASSSKYGIVFAASPDGTLSTYYLKDLIDKEGEGKHVSTRLPGKPTHIAVSCDHELLAVTDGQVLGVYKVADFTNPNVPVSMNIRFDVNTSTFVSALQWNPCIPDSIAVAFYDGTLLVSQVSTGQLKKIVSKARCICWSPKGKQLVTGNSDGTLTQYKPDLTPAKTVPAPNLFEGAPVEALAIYWISTYQFAIVFKNASDNSKPAVTIVNTPKVGQPSCNSFEDICYSMGTNRPWYYYLQGIPQWNIILCSSSNSMELATLGSADGASWLQWCQSDEGRPELPLTNKRIENYPVGICIDTCAIHQLPWGENETLPHMPLLLVVSHTGLLTIFNIINMRPAAAQICSPLQALTLPESAMTSDIPGESPPAPVQQPQQSQLQQQLQAPPAYLPQPPQQNTAQPQSIPPAFTPAQAQTASSQFTAMGFGAKSLQATQPVVSQVQQPPPQVKAVPTSQPVAKTVQKPSTLTQSKPQSPLTQESTALKEEQEKISKMKADTELKGMLLREVREFQMEAYKFAVKTREAQIKLQKELNSMSYTSDIHTLDVEQLRRACDLEELRARTVQLKLELLRACAVVADTTTHAQFKEVSEWSYADPLTTKRIASIKKLEYYIQTQLDQAQKALDHKWSDMLQQNPQYKQGRMIRPILDDIYQPLVKQQEILSRQSAVLRTLKNTLNECNMSPIIKSTALLRSTPFRNKDPLSKLTKNILNMSIESKHSNKAESAFSAHKLDALRDMLANNKVIKIKPVNIELTEHMKAIRLSYEKSMREQARSEERSVKQELTVEKQESNSSVPRLLPASFAKQNVPGLANVARTLFTDNVPQEPASIQQQLPPSSDKPFTFASQPSEPQRPSISLIPKTTELTKPIATFPAQTPESPIPSFTFSAPNSEIKKTTPAFSVKSPVQKQPVAVKTKPVMTFDSSTRKPLVTVTQNSDVQKLNISLVSQTSEAPTSSPTINTRTRSILKDLLNKNDENTFMGQKICSPTAFSFSAATTTATSTPLITAKPIADISNMFNKFQTVEPKPTEKAKSDETGEVEASATPTDNTKKPQDETPKSSATIIVPDVLKSTQDVAKPKQEKSEAQEIVPEKNKALLKPSDKENTPKLEEINKTLPSPPDSLNITPVNTETKADAKPDATSSASSIFAAAASKPSSIFGASPSKSIFGDSAQKNTMPKSLFGSPTSPGGSIFAATTSSSPFSSSIFGVKTTASSEVKPTEPINSTTATTPEANKAAPSTDTKAIFGVEPALSKPVEVVKPSSSEAEQLTPPAETKPTVFSTPTPASPPSLFGNQSPKPTSVFGAAAASAASIFASANTQASVFGSTPTTTQSVFGSTTLTTQPVFPKSDSAVTSPTFGATTAQSTFGTATTATQQSVFGSTVMSTPGFGVAVTTTPAPVFAATTTTQSIFGATPSPSQSIFGTVASPTSVFGATTGQSVFGAPTTQSSVFETQTATTQSSLFGTAPAQPSIFGQAASSTSSIFGSQATTTASSGSLFGGADNLFASASISTTSAPSQSGGSIFGGGSSTFASSNTNVFGSKTTFGAPNPSTAAIFGGGSSFGQKPAENTNFWGSGGNNNTSGGFGSSGFGQPVTTQSSIFGGGSGGSFSSPSPSGGAFSSPTPQSSVFGTPQQQSPSFGGSPAFGSKAAFGQPSAFGSPPAGGFGSGATFGGFNKSPGGFGASASFGGGATFGGSAFGGASPSKVFGGGSPSAGFGSTQSNATFENLATQNTMTFGNLAQQSAPAQPAPAFNTSPSFTGWRG